MRSATALRVQLGAALGHPAYAHPARSSAPLLPYMPLSAISLHFPPAAPRSTEFKEIGQLGQGNFSKVLRARHRINGAEFAVKRTIREVTPDNPAFAQFVQVGGAAAVAAAAALLPGLSWLRAGP